MTSATNSVKPPSVPRITLSHNLICWISATETKPVIAAKNVANKMGRKTSAGLAAPSWARYVMMLTGTKVKPLVTSTMNIIIGLEARFLSGLVSCISRNACKPSGVAALSIPSIVALMFISIEPNAG